MGGRGANTGVARDVNFAVNRPLAVSAAQAKVNNDATFTDQDSSPYHDLYNGRKYYLSQSMSIDTEMALYDYLHDKGIYDPATGSSIYSPSQVLNHHLRQGLPINGNQRAMMEGLDEGMHNLGFNTNLTRYDRVDYLLDNFGITTSMLRNTPANVAKIQKLLSGKTYVDKGYGSTSYNDFKKAPGGNPFTDKAVRLRISAPAKTQVIMPGIGPGGDLGEVIVGRNQNYRVTGFRFTGTQGRSGGSYYDQIEIDVEIY